MAKPKVSICCETRSDISSIDIARKLLGVLYDQPYLVPDKVAYDEPIKYPLICLDDVIQNWWAQTEDTEGKTTIQSWQGTNYLDVFLKRSKSPTYWVKFGFVFLTGQNAKMPARIVMEAQWKPGIDYERVLQTWCETTEADFGSLHLFTDLEMDGFAAFANSIEDLDARYDFSRSVNSFRLGSFMSPHRQSLPNMGWAQFIGNSQEERVDLTTIEEAGFPIKRLQTGSIISVSSNLNDVQEDFNEFSNKRNRLKALFPNSYFEIKYEPFSIIQVIKR